MTGTIGVDGVLSVEESILLNRLQEDTARDSLMRLDTRNPGELFPMVAMATGIGKGNIIHRVIESRIRRNPDAKILLIAGTKNVLVTQTHEALLDYQTAGADYITAEEDDDLVEETTDLENNPLSEKNSLLYKTGKIGTKGVNVEIGTIQTVQSKILRNELNPDDYDLLIVDEVHNIGTPKRKAVVEQFTNALGFTATAHRHSGQLKSPDQYGFEIIKSYPLPEAQQDRLLPPLLGIQLDTKDLVDEIPMTSKGTINYKELEKLLKESPELRPYIVDRLIPIIVGADGKKYKIVVAVNFVWEAQELAELFAAKGIKAGLAVHKGAAKKIHTEEIPALDAEERYKLPQEHPDAVQVLISPYVAAEGFDAPFTEVVCWASPTDSPLRYTQYTGRLARRANGKAFGVVVDCLYQTSKYSWSYNMGMWMKGDVRQLGNGMLYLGPESDIDTLRDLAAVETMSSFSDKKSLDALQSQGLLEVQPGDFSLATAVLVELFVGGNRELRPIFDRVKLKLTEDHPEIFITRKSGKTNVQVIPKERKQLFVDAMVQEGARLRDYKLKPIQETDFPLSADLRKFFTGTWDQISLAMATAKSIVEAEHPESIEKRKNKNTTTLVITTEEGKVTFIREMEKQGIRKKREDIQVVQSTDLSLSIGDIKRLFVGNYKILISIRQSVLANFKKEYPEFLATRKKTNSTIEVITEEGRELFIQAMIERGAILRDEEKVKRFF